MSVDSFRKFWFYTIAKRSPAAQNIRGEPIQKQPEIAAAMVNPAGATVFAKQGKFLLQKQLALLAPKKCLKAEIATKHVQTLLSEPLHACE